MLWDVMLAVRISLIEVLRMAITRITMRESTRRTVISAIPFLFLPRLEFDPSGRDWESGVAFICWERMLVLGEGLMIAGYLQCIYGNLSFR